MKQRIKQIGAIAIILLLLACVVLTLVFAVTGNHNFLGMLMITLVLPVLLWAFLFFYRRSH